MDSVLVAALRSCFDKLSKKLPSLLPGTYNIDETISIRVVGSVDKIEDEEYTPTVSIPYKKAFEMFLARMGFQREGTMEALVQSMTDAVNGVCPADVGLENYIRVDDVEEIVQNGLAAMPKKIRSGKTFVDCTFAVVPVVNSPLQTNVP